MKEEGDPKAKEINDLLIGSESLPHQTLYRLAEQMFDSSIIHKITDLSSDQTADVMQFELANALYYKRYSLVNKERYDTILCRALEYRLSKNRESRKEMVKMFEAMNAPTGNNTAEVL